MTKVTLDMLRCAQATFVQEPNVQGEEVLTLMEMTLKNLTDGDKIDHQDFLDRVDILASLGKTVLISNFGEYHRLAAYFFRYTKKMIGMAMGVPTLKEIFDEKYYADLAGGILESFGRMFKNDLKLYVYPLLEAKNRRADHRRQFARRAQSAPLARLSDGEPFHRSAARLRRKRAVHFLPRCPAKNPLRRSRRGKKWSPPQVATKNSRTKSIRLQGRMLISFKDSALNPAMWFSTFPPNETKYALFRRRAWFARRWQPVARSPANRRPNRPPA